MALGVIVPRALEGSSTGATVALETIEIYFAKSPGAPRRPNDRGIESAQWSVFAFGFQAAAGVTGADGKITFEVMQGIPHTLRVLGSTYELNLRTGALEPLTDFTGQQRRLRLLGYQLGHDGPDNNGVDGQMRPQTDRAILEFQSDQGLEADGNVGPLTREGLRFEVGE
jgi:hypothetical protein